MDELLKKILGNSMSGISPLNGGMGQQSGLGGMANALNGQQGQQQAENPLAALLNALKQNGAANGMDNSGHANGILQLLMQGGQ